MSTGPDDVRNVGVIGHPGATEGLDVPQTAEDSLGPNLRRIDPEEARRWKSFGLQVLVLCESPFSEWSISAEPGLGMAASQVRHLAARCGVSVF